MVKEKEKKKEEKEYLRMKENRSKSRWSLSWEHRLINDFGFILLIFLIFKIIGIT